MKPNESFVRMEEIPSLTNLISFLHETLLITEEVKHVLKTNCDEGIFCLKPWHVEVTVQQEINKDACICLTSESEIEEIATDISRTLLQTQQLRDKLSLNLVVKKESSNFRKCDSLQKHGNIEHKRLKNLGGNRKCSEQENTRNMIVDKKLQKDTGKTNVCVKNKDLKDKNRKSATCSIKLTENKNFLEINKQSIKNIVGTKQCKDIKYKLENNPITKPKCLTFGERPSAASTSELKCLIQKVSNKSSSSTIFNEHDKKCPLHGKISSPFIYKQNLICMNIVDGLSMANIPGEIIRSLRIYYAYLDVEHSKQFPTGKQQIVIHNFLVELNKVDKAVESAQKNFTTFSLPKYITLFRSSFSKNVDVSISNKVKYAELNSVCAMYEVMKRNTKEWMPNGIWYLENIKNFEGISRACCISYIQEDQLLLFFNTLQRLQHIQYYKKLIKLVINVVLPYMQNSFKCTESEYAKMYKMISILHQGLKSKLPVLVRTDKY